MTQNCFRVGPKAKFFFEGTKKFSWHRHVGPFEPDAEMDPVGRLNG